MPKDSLKDDVISRLDQATLLGVINSCGVRLVKAGSEFKCICPAHVDTHPSCTINVKKLKTGIFKCFSCGFSADIFGFVEKVQGVEFRAALEFVAGVMGIGPKKVASVNAAPKVATVHRAVEVLSAADIFDEWEKLRESRLPDSLAKERLGVNPKALDATHMFFCHYRGSEVLVAPMRTHEGELCSLRFRCSKTKRRWSLDKKDASGEQIASSRSGLMASFHVFDVGTKLGQYSVTIEGETDLLAGTSMMIDEYGEEPLDWPAMFIALPGVMSCHEMLTKDIVGVRPLIFFDRDAAGERAVFDTRWRDKDGHVDLTRDVKIGLLRKHADAGIIAVAAFPPRKPDGSKTDLRDLYKAGWKWLDLEEHFLTTGTRDVLGLRHRKAT